jgi:hypothetical protein
MPLEVVEERCLASVRDEALSLLAATRAASIDTARYDWLYLNNPDGPAVFWSVRETTTGEMAGFTVALPRRVIVSGGERLCWNCADFSMKPQFRTLGPALKLRRAARDGVDAGRVDFLYAHPNPRMAAIHERVGHSALAPMVRVARMLRTAPYLEEKMSSRMVAAFVGGVVDPYLKFTAPERRHSATCDVRLHHDLHFDQRFCELFAEFTGSLKVAGVRDARYLNWRYARNPLQNMILLTAQEHDRLRGWLAFSTQDDVAVIHDVFPPENSTACRDLISEVLQEARRRSLKSVSFTALETNSLLPIFQEFGFHKRPETGRMFVYAIPGHADRETLLDPCAWHVTVGDRDI